MTDHDDDSTDDSIPLEAVLKLAGIFPTGGQAKHAIQSGEVTVNGKVETRRKKKCHVGDVVGYQDLELTVELES